MGQVRFASGLEKLFVPINSVKQHPKNPRNGDLDAIIESIRVNGYVAPIMVQRSTGYIVAGNHRWQSLHALGSEVVPAIFVDYNDEEAMRYMLADNATSDKGKNDDALLLELLRDMEKTDLGLIGSGFDNDDLERLILDLEPEPIPEMGGGLQAAVHGIYEVTVSFDNPDDRAEFTEEMRERFGDEDVREANI